MKPENSFHSHRGPPITATATSVMSLCVLSAATSPLFRKAHLLYLHACSCAGHHISSDTNVCGKEALPCSMSGLLCCISCCRCPAIYIDETGRLFVNKDRFPVSRNFYVRTCIKFTFASKIEATHERSLVNVNIEPRSTPCSNSAFLCCLYFIYVIKIYVR